MGASNSRLEEDKSLQLCRSRKKFIKQALNGRCSLAAAHIGYIEELKIIGSALRRFVEFDSQFEPLAHSSTYATPEPHSLKSVSRLSFSSRSLSQNVDAIGNLSPPSSTPVSTQFQSHHMKFKGSFSTKVEEKPPVPFAVSVSSTTPLTTTPRSTEVPEASAFEAADEPENPPWDYFGLSNPTEQRFSAQEGRGFDQGLEKPDGREDSQISDDEFDEPATATLVRRFKNVNMSKENLAKDSSSLSSEDKISETMFPSADNVKETKEDIVNGISQTEFENQVELKDFITSMKTIDQLFARASESGKEVIKMLEANKLHFRQVIHGKQRKLFLCVFV